LCTNISPGLYHYCPKEHRLEKISALAEAVDALLEDARRSAKLAETPQILITIAARFQRLSWKYESMAYSALLKNVGVLYQTMYLVATAMDLAPCALGGGTLIFSFGQPDLIITPKHPWVSSYSGARGSEYNKTN